MFKTTELRWFSDKPQFGPIDWFRTHGLSFESIKPRTDSYLPLKLNSMNVKLREGNLEIKHRIGHPFTTQLAPNVSGIREEWVKWSFSVENDRLASDILDTNKYQWVDVTKSRMAVQLTQAPDGSSFILPINQYVSSACQIEYTKVRLHDSTYFTFGLEWFENQFVELKESLLKDICQNDDFSTSNSMSYPGFLLHK